MSSRDQTLDDRMAGYVRKDTLMSRLPTVMRLDGRAFGTFTENLPKPYDARFGAAMKITAEYLARKFNPTLIHTQSDEITMLFDYTDIESCNMHFGGRVDKINSIFAAAASVKFAQAMGILVPELVNISDLSADMPEIDCRTYQLPSMSEATNVFLWRAQDCTRNSVQMLARYHYTQTQCHGKSTRDLLTMLDQDGINWADYPGHFKEGTYFRKRKFLKVNRHGETWRTRIEEVEYHKFSSFTNREDIVFYDAQPEDNKNPPEESVDCSNTL